MSKKRILYIVGGVFIFLFLASLIPSTPTQKVEQARSEDVIATDQAQTEKVEPITGVSGEQNLNNQTRALSDGKLLPEPTPNSSQTYSYFQVVDVVDGDTIKISLSGSQKTLRLIGIDTPETVDPRKTVQCFGKEASNKAKELLSGKRVRIESDPTQGDLDKYGRTLAYVYREDGLFFNKYMIEQGYAHEYTYDLPYKYQTDFKAAEGYARENQLGLWSPSTCNGSSVAVNETQTPAGTAQYYTSSYTTSKYYYPVACTAWKDLSTKYLKGFDTLDALLSAYPARTLSPQCR